VIVFRRLHSYRVPGATAVYQYLIVTYRGETVRNLLPNRTEFIDIHSVVVV